MAERKDKKDICAIAAENIEKYRTRVGLSQERLSEACGLHESYVGRLERTGGGNPGLRTLQLIADKLGVTVIDLLTPNKRSAR